MGLSFDISYSGLVAAQKGLKVTQSNIANINSEGYVRQQLQLQASSTMSGAGAFAEIGSGVLSEQILRIKDDFLIAQSRGEKSQVGFFESMSSNLTSIENVFNETSEGSVSKLLAQFFNAWEELSKYPEENSYRHALLSKAEALASKFNEINKGINRVSDQMDRDIEIQVKKVNELVGKIVEVNEKIARSAMERPNNLLDERDRYLDELSKYTDIEVSNDIKNPLLVNVKIGGTHVINGTESREIATMYDRDAKEWLIVTGNTQINLTSGSLYANVHMKNDVIHTYKEKLDGFASTLITEVNAIHQSGYGLDNTTGMDFFLGSDISNIQLNGALKTNPEKIATSSQMDAPGNSDIAKALSNLKDANVLSSGTANPISYYNGFAIEMASALNVVNDNKKVHENILMSVESDRQAVQGVNMDEELANLLVFQQYYTANSKVISTVDKIFNVLLQMI